jgi:hypothetical protein
MVMLDSQLDFSATNPRHSRLSGGFAPVRGRPRVPTQAERAQWNEEARQRLRSQSPLRRLAMVLTSVIWRIVVHLENHQRKFPFQSPLSNEYDPNGPVPQAPKLNPAIPADHRIQRFPGDAPKKGWTAETAGVPVTDSVEMAGGEIGVGGLVRDIGPEDAKNDGKLTESGDANGTPSRDPKS